jgi:cellulose biosynthesis protein BcsQ
VLSFFSFKGGVGRTTALALMALDLVARGKRVVCIDLDLEAPGLGELLDALPARGLIDLILEHGICGSLPTGIDDGFVEVRPGLLWVMPAHGRLPESDCGMGYIARLGRLDYLTQHEKKQSPVRASLEAVLKKVKAELRPDYILLDSRAGLHDLGGLSLHALAHLDVIVLRDNSQNLRGLEMTLRALTLRRGVVETLAIVCGFAPKDDRYRGLLMDELKEKLYGIFRRTGVYRENTPAMEGRREDYSALHHPFVLREQDELPRAERLDQLEATILSSPTLREDMTTMTSALLERLRVERLNVERAQ